MWRSECLKIKEVRKKNAVKWIHFILVLIQSPNSLYHICFLLSSPSSSTQVVIQAGVCEHLHQSEWVIKSYCSITICVWNTPGPLTCCCCEWNKVSHTEEGNCRLLPFSDASFSTYTYTRKMIHSVPFNTSYRFLQKMIML